MRKTELPNCPQWLLDAATENEDVIIDGFGRVVWRGGEWRGGEWRGGEWCDGEWCGGKVSGRSVQRLHTLAHCEGYPKTLCAADGIAYILAGCRFFTLADARKHWADRTDRPITRAMLVGMAEVAKDWGLREE